jgi:hypothetical protein
MIIVIIFLLLILSVIFYYKKTEHFKDPETEKIQDKKPDNSVYYIENINIKYDNNKIVIIPIYKNSTSVKLLVLNYSPDNIKLPIRINYIDKELDIKKKYNEIVLKDNKFNFEKKEFNIKCKIPKIIMQTGRSNRITKNKYLSIQSIINNNKNYKYEYFNDNSALKFIKKHFDKGVVNAYNKLIPGAYKADLFRYCYLYINGGIYIDCKMICHINFDDLIGNNDIVLVKDIGERAYWNGFICAIPKMKIFKKCIDNIVENVKNKYYGESSLDITGPTLFYKNVINDLYNYNYKILQFHHIHHGHPENYIYDGNTHKKILNISYPTYYDENDYKAKDHYSNHWNNRTVYK